MHARQKLDNMLETAYALRLTAARLGSSLMPDVPPNTLSPESAFVDAPTAGRRTCLER